MNISFAKTLRNYQFKNLPKDLLTGIIIALVSIPISMGYSQIAGLPAVYGLYGSVFPILFFALFTTSPQFIFGVDAAPAALVGAELITLGIEAGSKEAMEVVPVMTFFIALWLLLFYVIKAGKLVNFISTPVMGGFISGICSTIILMQVPKIYGGTSGTGELIELLEHILETSKDVNIYSLLLGIGTLTLLLLSKKIMPKFPMAVVVMFLGAIVSKLTDIFTSKNIICLSAVEAGLPKVSIPNISEANIVDIMGVSLSVAIVIMAETLLASNSFAQKNGYKLDDNQELLAFSVGNFAAAFTGCCPINGSVSRTAMGEQYGGKTQVTGIVAGVVMALILIFGTGFIGYLPVPVLTAIVISALIGATEFEIATKLWKMSRMEFYIFCGAFLGVLVLGTINGVLIGIILSFAEVIIRNSDPPRCFLGIIPGHTHFQNISHFKTALPIKNVVVYRFSANLFFANIGIFVNDIENSITDNTKAVIVDASAVGSMDITAAEQLEKLYETLKKKNISLYITEHIPDLNEQMRKLGIGYLIEEGAVRRNINVALKDMGIRKPYPLEGGDNQTFSAARKRAENRIQEFVWAFGDGAEDAIERQITIQIEKLKKTGDIESLVHGNWHHMDVMDEDEWLEHLEVHIKEIVKISGKNEQELAKEFEGRRMRLINKMEKDHPELLEKFKERHKLLDKHLKEHRPEVYEIIQRFRKELDNKS